MSEKMTDELAKRASQKPDAWTNAWWNSQFQEVLASNRGLKHALHLALAEMEDLGKKHDIALGRIAALETASEMDRSKIGELQERMNKASEIVAKLQNGKATR